MSADAKKKEKKDGVPRRRLKARIRTGEAAQTRLFAGLPEPTDDITVPIGPVMLVDGILRWFGLDALMNGLKRDQGARVFDVVRAPVAHTMQMDGLSINRMEDVLEDARRRCAYGLGADVDRNDLYRTTERVGACIDAIVSEMDRVLVERHGLDIAQAFIDWSASYVDGRPTGLVRFGNSKDHRPDRPQVTIGMAMESAHRLLCGLTVMPGNTNDCTHLRENLAQLKPFLSPGCLIVFDARAYSEENGGLRASEIYDMYRAEEERGREPGDRSKAGNVMVLSSLNIHAKEIYRLYKERVAVEGFFDTCKSDLGGDATYLSTDRKVMGYNFVTFLAFCIWWGLRDMLRKGGLESRLTPHSLLRGFSAVKVFHTPQGRVASDVPKDVRDVASKIGVELTSGYIPQKV